MNKYVIVKENKVENIIVADTKALAEEVTGLEVFEFNPNNPAHIGLGFDGDTFEQPLLIAPDLEDVSTGTE